MIFFFTSSQALLVLPSGSSSSSSGEVPSASLRLESQLTVGPASAAALGLPVLLDKSSLTTCSVSPSVSSLSLPGPSSSAGGRGVGLTTATAMSHRYLLEQAQYLVADLASRWVTTLAFPRCLLSTIFTQIWDDPQLRTSNILTNMFW